MSLKLVWIFIHIYNPSSHHISICYGALWRELLCMESFIFHAWTKKHNFVKFFCFNSPSIPCRLFISSFPILHNMWSFLWSNFSSSYEREGDEKWSHRARLPLTTHPDMLENLIFPLKALTLFFFMRPPPFYNPYMISFTWHHHLLFKYAHRSLLWHSKWYGNKK